MADMCHPFFASFRVSLLGFSSHRVRFRFGNFLLGHGLQRVYIPFNLGEFVVFSDLETVFRLKVKPEFRRGLEVASQTQRRIDCHARRSATISAIRVTGTRRSSVSLFVLSP